MEEDIKLLEKINITTYGTKEELEIDLSEEELNQIIKNLINKYKEQEAIITALKGANVVLNQELKTEKARLERIIELMLIDLSKGCYYEDDAAQVCEVKRAECTQYRDIECSMCLLEYYEKKARGK